MWNIEKKKEEEKIILGIQERFRIINLSLVHQCGYSTGVH